MDDMISKLQDSLISQILSYLTTKEAVRTSVLSNRWKNLWLLIPGLDLNSKEFSDYSSFASFIDKCLDFSKEEKSCLHKLKLSIHKGLNDNNNDQSCVTRWISFLATTRKLKNLDVEYFVNRKCLEVIPVSLFICESLLYLRLRQVLFVSSFEDSSSVSLPRLKTLRLEHNVYANEKSLESLISSCPVLEDLSIVRKVYDNVRVLRVRSQSLISLDIKYHFEFGDHEDDEEFVDYFWADDDDNIDYELSGVLIDAPRLESLSFKDEISPCKTITNSGSLTKVNILGLFHLKESIFLTTILGVKDMKISFSTFKYIKRMMTPSTQFCNMSCLEAEFGFYDLETVQTLLACCPNLKSLILEIIDTKEGEQMRISPVPQCLLSSLEFVEIRCDLSIDRTMELVRYFAENSVILKKLVLCCEEEDPVGLSDLLALPTRSSTCQIIFVNL